MSEMVRRAPRAGLVAGIAAAAVGAAALGYEIQRQVVGRRLQRREVTTAPLFELTGEQREVVTSDGLHLHTEIDEADPEVLAEVENPVTVVFVHGFVLSLHCFHFQRKSLLGQRRMVLYDQRSHGRSERSSHENCRVPQLAVDLRAVLAQTTEPGERVVLIGHSMGGMTIMDYARQFPEEFAEKVQGVGFIATSGGDLEKHSIVPGVSGNVFSAMAPGLLALASRVPSTIERTRRHSGDLMRVLTRRFAYGSDVSQELVEFMSEMIAQTPLEVVADFYPAFATFNGREGLQLLQQVESMVVGGARDVILPISHTERLIKQLPGAETWLAPEGGHMVQISHPNDINPMIDRLIRRAERHIAGSLL